MTNLYLIFSQVNGYFIGSEYKTEQDYKTFDKILMENHNDYKEVVNMISLGNGTHLGPTIEETVFENSEDEDIYIYSRKCIGEIIDDEMFQKKFYFDRECNNWWEMPEWFTSLKP